MDLASLVILHLNRLLPSHDSTVTGQTVYDLIGLAYLIGSTSAAVRGQYDSAFRDALLSHGLVTSLTIASRALSQSTDPVAEIELKGLFGALVGHLSCFPRPRWITEALRAGLLPAVFACGTARHIEGTGGSLVDLLQSVLPASTVYHSVLSQLQVSLVEVGDAGIFGDPDLLGHWESFVELVESRLQIMEEYHTDSLTATKACDSLERMLDFTILFTNMPD
ncbi:hypothetical protein B0H13DRAFT_2462668 [Mycena leptocephala]|nr:hypothetical protein B0H13DRAFT_2462668 [Mycena leptocephala]